MNLDDKLLGEKTHYYCSSSEDEDNNNNEDDDDEKCRINDDISKKQPSIKTGFIPESELKNWDGLSVNTGPKGVIKDWQRYKQLEAEQRESQELEKLELIKKLSLQCRSHLDDEKEKQKKEQENEDIENLLLNDPYLQVYMQQRMKEMMRQVEDDLKNSPVFGNLINLESGTEFLDAIDKEKKNIIIICHIYRYDSIGCESMNDSLQSLAKKYKNVKFCCLEAASAGMSKHFEDHGVPALLVYKDGSLIGNFVRLTDEFGDEFFADDVETFLVEHGFLPDQSLVPTLIRSSIKQSAIDDDDDDSE